MLAVDDADHPPIAPDRHGKLGVTRGVIEDIPWIETGIVHQNRLSGGGTGAHDSLTDRKSDTIYDLTFIRIFRAERGFLDEVAPIIALDYSQRNRDALQRARSRN
jgi:hypothetical protein